MKKKRKKKQDVSDEFASLVLQLAEACMAEARHNYSLLSPEEQRQVGKHLYGEKGVDKYLYRENKKNERETTD